MDDGSAQKSATAAAFGENAAEYVNSDTHSQGEDLELLATWCADATVAIDIATGAGHTAGALAAAGVDAIIAVDAAPKMVVTGLDSYPDLTGIVTDAERLPFAADSVDAVTCRIAAHHFPEPKAFVDEVARVLRPGGTLAFEDNVVPNDDRGEFFNRLEKMRDPTHVESYPTGTWTRWFEAAGLSVVVTDHLMKPIQFEPWVDRTGSLDTHDRDRVKQFLLDAPKPAIDFFNIQYANGQPESFGSLKAMIRATFDG